nr:Uncharacterized protein A9P81_1790 [Leptospira interrogans serovar Copenhageni/Icterohaemorrhagiae]
MFPGFNFMGIHRVILILKRTYLLDIKLTILLYMLSVKFQKSIEKEIRKLLRTKSGLKILNKTLYN